jgi:hypothetical protein
MLGGQDSASHDDVSLAALSLDSARFGKSKQWTSTSLRVIAVYCSPDIEIRS